jgi:hypothetical protein
MASKIPIIETRSVFRNPWINAAQTGELWSKVLPGIVKLAGLLRNSKPVGILLLAIFAS